MPDSSKIILTVTFMQHYYHVFRECQAFSAVFLKSSIEEFFLGVIIKGNGFTLITWSGVAVPLEEYDLTFFPLSFALA